LEQVQARGDQLFEVDENKRHSMNFSFAKMMDVCGKRSQEIIGMHSDCLLIFRIFANRLGQSISIALAF